MTDSEAFIFAEKLCAYVYDKDFISYDAIRMIAEQLKVVE